MEYLKERALVNVNAAAIAQFLALAGVATALPFFFHFQWATGPIVNALLIIALLLLGIRSAFLLCLIPSLMALAGGLLPPVMAPVVPFIMISNVLFVFTIDYFYRNAKNAIQGYWIGVFIGAGLKYLFLYLNVSLMMNLILKEELAAKVSMMMSWTQLATALAGGFIAFVVLKSLKRI
jgi:hypothetical protein